MNEVFDSFWKSFEAWFLRELPYSSMLKGRYKHYDNWDGGTYYVDIDYSHLYRLHYGVEWEDIFTAGAASINNFKPFIEVIYEDCIQERYQFTIFINERLKKFKVPYRLQNGKFVKEGYKGTERIDKIISYEMCERKIKFSEEMISSRELLDKKVALDYIVDSLQYLISISSGKNVSDKYKSLALTIATDENNKIYSVIKTEFSEVMKISNEFFDIRHNEYLNQAKEKRESLNDKMFIEYLYNRIYTLAYLIRLNYSAKSKEESQNG